MLPCSLLSSRRLPIDERLVCVAQSKGDRAGTAPTITKTENKP